MRLIKEFFMKFLEMEGRGGGGGGKGEGEGKRGSGGRKGGITYRRPTIVFFPSNLQSFSLLLL